MRSANEISGMVLKAARGAGMPLGCAEDLARAVPALCALGALSLVLDLLEGPFDAPRYENGALLDGHPVLAMLAWRDLTAAGRAVRLDCAVDPLLRSAMLDRGAVAGPFEVDSALWATLAGFAERTFVPESAASRLAGAGAGLTDND